MVDNLMTIYNTHPDLRIPSPGEVSP
jgi:hypothetical protein